MAGLWRRVYPRLDTGVAVDFHVVYGVDLDATPSAWDTRTWHWFRDRILRLAAIDGTAVREAATN